MQVNIQSERNASTVWYILEDDDLYYPQGMKALQDSELKTFLSCKRSTMDGQIKLSYDISGMETLVSAMKYLDKEQLYKVLETVIQSVLTVRGYGIIKLDTTELSPEKIFVSADRSRVGMIYVPCVSPRASAETAESAERAFREELSSLIKKSRGQREVAIHNLADDIGDADGQSLEAVLSKLQRRKKDPDPGPGPRPGPKREPKTDPGPKREPKTDPDPKRDSDPDPIVIKRKKRNKEKLRIVLIIQCLAVVAGAAAYFLGLAMGGILAVLLADGMAVLLFLIRRDIDKPENKKPKENDKDRKSDPKKRENGNYTVLLVEFTPSIRLTGLNTPSKFVLKIDKENFKIGRVEEDEDGVNDGVVAFDRTVSSHHCTIQSRDGRNYIIDNKSKNGTKLNDSKLTPDKEYPIKIGDTLKISRWEFSVDAY